MRARSLILLVILVASSFAFAPARAESALVADAGDSKTAYSGALLPLTGRALGGVAPYSYAWSWDGDASRIADAAAANTTFDGSGLAPQDVVLTLTVIDGNGATASDSVRHRLDDAPILVQRSIPVTAGVPDEFVVEGGLGLDRRTFTFSIPANTARIVAVMDWQNGVIPYDLDFELVDPSGNVAGDGQGETDRQPERIVIDAPPAGGWTARILPFLSGQTVANVTIQGFPAGSLPRVSFESPVRFGGLDEQRVSATATGTAPITLQWDFDGDGLFDATGEEAVATLPVGAHTIRIRATDGVGYRVSTTGVIEVLEADTVLRMRCGGEGGAPYIAMEYTVSKGTCWIHGGHQTYFTGAQRFGFRYLSGFVFSVEQQFSPPTELVLEDPGVTPIHLEVSDDGISWTQIGIGSYQFLPDVADGSLALQERQFILVEATGSGESFRYLRARQPLSAAQGLSGYLDFSAFDVQADILDVVAPATSTTSSRAFDCAASDHMEDVFTTHPCWFGGIDRYDAPSFFHTYPLGEDATISRLNGSVTLLPWRSDDWTQGDAIGNATNISAFVQTSMNGVEWTNVAQVGGTFGSPIAFDLALDDAPARFVRFFPDYHARFDQTAQFAPNHHPKGFFVDSRVTVEGVLPAA